MTYRLFAGLILAVSVSACTTTQAEKHISDTPEAVVNAPVKALNIDKTEIPEFLQDRGNPYKRPANMNCAALTQEIEKLTAFAGPDWDSDDHYTKQGRTTAEFVDAILPYGGLVRFISGAKEHQKELGYALDYANVRRAYLKSVGERLGCPSPAKPVR